MTRTLTEPAREIEVLGDYDVLVAGGGPAGLSAALAAALSVRDDVPFRRVEIAKLQSRLKADGAILS